MNVKTAWDRVNKNNIVCQRTVWSYTNGQYKTRCNDKMKAAGDIKELNKELPIDSKSCLFVLRGGDEIMLD